MQNINVTKTRQLDLCTSCEICSAVCPAGAIEMCYGRGQFLPYVDEGRCVRCGLCLRVCPGIDISPFSPKYDRITVGTFAGPCLESYTAYTRDARIRENSTSGGVVTTLISAMVSDKEFDAAFVLPFEVFDCSAARLKAVCSMEAIRTAAKSKYVPASAYEVIKALEKGDDKRYIIVGTGCLLHGLTKYLAHKKLPSHNLLMLGLFCDRTLNFNIIRYFEETYKKANESLAKIEYRTKEKSGWPGNVKLVFSSGREVIVHRTVRMGLKQYFQLNRCLYCVDKFNVAADIAFGDCYIKSTADRLGKSSVIVRTQRGCDVLQRYSHLLVLQNEPVSKISESQSLIRRKDNLEYSKIFAKNNHICEAGEKYQPSLKNAGRLAILNKHIRWGQDYNIRKIRCSRLVANLAAAFRVVFDAAKLSAAFVVTAGQFLRLFVGSCLVKATAAKKTGKYIVVIGGQLLNKGAQAMTFTVVDEIKRRFPHKDICVFSTKDFARDQNQSYNFRFLPWAPQSRIRLLLGPMVKDGTPYACMEQEVKRVLKDSYFAIDISGYALSSQWGFSGSLGYLINILIARKYSIPYYIFPQSLGPFNYPFVQKLVLEPLLRLCLRYPRVIFVRERKGLEYLAKYTRSNVQQSCDIVLQKSSYNLENIYSAQIKLKVLRIEPNSVGVIPNLRITTSLEQRQLCVIYHSLIKTLIEAGRTAYILRHSEEDLTLCRDIKNMFADNNKVKLITDDLNAVELENILKQFDFVIASRYHSVIHSYKNGVPVLVIGWAEKYYELLKQFDQLEYYSDCRDSISVDEINGKLRRMLENLAAARKTVACTMDSLPGRSVFDILQADLNGW